MLSSNKGNETDVKKLASSHSCETLESACWNACANLPVVVETVLRIYKAKDMILFWKKLKYIVFLSFSGGWEPIPIAGIWNCGSDVA